MKLNEFSLHSASLQKATMYLSLNITEKTHARPLEHLKKTFINGTQWKGWV